MDTPERNQMGTPITNFEDSPVFNYINNLSPIKPVKSVHITQTFHSLSFASIPSVFTSPHVSSQREFRFLKRNNLADFSKPLFSSDDGKYCKVSKGVPDGVHLADSSADPEERCDIRVSMEEDSVTPIKHGKLAIVLPKVLPYDCISPNRNSSPSYVIKIDPDKETASTPEALVGLVQEGPNETKHLFGSEVEVQGVSQLGQTKEEGPECDWENLISDAADLLIYDASAEPEGCQGHDRKFNDRHTSSFSSLGSEPPQVNIADAKIKQSLDSLDSCDRHDLSDLSTRIDDSAGEMPLDSEVDFQQQHGLLRRCLIFEVAGAYKKRLEDELKSNSSNMSQSDGKFVLDDKQPLSPKTGIGSSPCVLPGIGLHLNTLATTSKDCRVVKQEVLFSRSRRRLISMPKAVGSSHSVTAEQKPINQSLALNSINRDLGPHGNEIQVIHDASQTTAFGAGEDFNHSSPKKKRRRMDNGGESEVCKRCNCKKSKCLKLYCECFAAGVYCVEPCSCQECFNKPVHEDTVLATRKQIESRNPLAFAPKVIRSSETLLDLGEEGNKTPASARHKRGCNCKKSSCTKKYCECYQGGVGCSSNCRCEGCKNVYGRKDGSTPRGADDDEPEDDELEISEKDGLNESLLIIESQMDEQQKSEGVLPRTPSFQICRSSKLPSFLSGKPPRASLPPVDSFPHLNTCQSGKKSDMLQLQPKFERHFQIKEDETPDILRGTGSPVNGVKSLSPNRKRVSPPHNELGSSPGRKSGRKLILQSIPSFPSLTPDIGRSDFPVRFQ